MRRVKTSKPPETEDRSENLTAGKRRYNRRSQLQNSPQQQQQQQVHSKLASLQHFVANLNAAEVGDKSDNSTAASRLYQLQNDLQQQQRQQQFEGMQQFLASLNANSMASLLSQNLSFLLPPPFSQSATGETKNSYVLFI